MKKKICICISVVVLAGVLAVAWLEAGNVRIAGRLRKLETENVATVSVLANPPGKKAVLEQAEVKELLEILDTVVVYNQDNSFGGYDGQWVEFDITMTDGGQMEVAVYPPFIIIDGTGYKAKYEPCQKLNGLGNRVIDKAMEKGAADNIFAEAGQNATEDLEDFEVEEPKELPRMVMVDGALYLDTGMVSHVLRCGVMDGEITSSVKEGEQPVKDNQSNFGKGYGYQRGVVDGRIEVYMDEAWRVFSKEEVDWGITLSTQDETSTGVVILCTQAGGNPTGELQTGGYYILETFQDGVWKEAPCFAEVAWTSEAWIIMPDSTVGWDVDWEWLYGELSPGVYRIGKNIMDFRDTGNYDSKMFYAEFAIVD